MNLEAWANTTCPLVYYPFDRILLMISRIDTIGARQNPPPGHSSCLGREVVRMPDRCGFLAIRLGCIAHGGLRATAGEFYDFNRAHLPYPAHTPPTYSRWLAPREVATEGDGDEDGGGDSDGFGTWVTTTCPLACYPSDRVLPMIPRIENVQESAEALRKFSAAALPLAYLAGGEAASHARAHPTEASLRPRSAHMRPRRFVSYLRTRGDLEAHHDCFGIPEPSTVQAISRSGRQLKPVVVAWVGFSCFCRFLTPLFTTPRGLRFASRGISPVMCAQTCYYSVLGTHFRPLQAKSRFENSLFTRQSAWRERTVNLDRYTVCTRAAHARPHSLSLFICFLPRVAVGY